MSKHASARITHDTRSLVIKYCDIVQLLSVCAVGAAMQVGLDPEQSWALIGRAGGFILGVGRALIEG